MVSRAEREVVALHRFFEAWLSGRMAQSADEFARFAEVVNEGFAIISPHGRVTQQDELMQLVYNGHGSRPNLRIWVEDFQLRRQDGRIALATYEEWQQLGDDAPTARISTVLFLINHDMPNDLEWLHVHETWMGKR